MRNLHIGGEERKEGWEIFNIQNAEYVDHVGNAADLSRFEDETFDCVYASHVLEHFSYNIDEKVNIHSTMAEWKRVLKKGGRLFVSVPNLKEISKILFEEDLPMKDRVHIIRMIYGGQTDENNFHYVGFDKELLLSVFHNAGLKRVWCVEKFGIFKDSSLGNWQSSKKIYTGLSINFIAEKE